MRRGRRGHRGGPAGRGCAAVAHRALGVALVDARPAADEGHGRAAGGGAARRPPPGRRAVSWCRSEKADQLAVVAPEGDGEPRLTDVGAHPHARGGGRGRADLRRRRVRGLAVGGRGRAVVRTVRVAEQPGGVAVTGDVVAVVSVRANVVETYDRRTLERLSTQNVGYGPSHVVAGEDGRLYIADTRGGGISVFSTRPRLRFEQRIDPAGQALRDRRRRRPAVGHADRPQRARGARGRARREADPDRSRRPTASPSIAGARCVHGPRRRAAAGRQPVRPVPASIVAGPSTLTEPRATTSAPNVTSPSTSKRSASASETGPSGSARRSRASACSSRGRA